MNSLKVLVNSLDELYPSKNEYKLGAEYQNEVTNNEIEEGGEIGHEGEKAADQNLSPKSTYLALIIQVIFFLPNYLLVKPLIFIWLLITYPFTHLFKQRSVSSELIGSGRNENNPSISNDRVSDMPSAINEKTELLKQENILANNIKSPTSSSKYIIPPPQRLYPLSRNPGKKRRKTLILDLDETLIHSLSRGSPRSFRGGSTHTIEIKINNVSSLYYVHKRPYCDFFLKEVAKWFDLQIFTASVKEYADPIIDWLESDISPYLTSNHDRQQGISRQVFTKRYYRTDCSYRPGVGYIKDLSKFFPRDDDLKNVIILDNSPISYALHEDNAVMIEGWINDQNDRDLLNLLPMLHSLSLCIDVRFILALRSGEKVFEK